MIILALLWSSVPASYVSMSWHSFKQLSGIQPSFIILIKFLGLTGQRTFCEIWYTTYWLHVWVHWKTFQPQGAFMSEAKPKLWQWLPQYLVLSELSTSAVFKAQEPFHDSLLFLVSTLLCVHTAELLFFFSSFFNVGSFKAQQNQIGYLRGRDWSRHNCMLIDEAKLLGTSTIFKNMFVLKSSGFKRHLKVFI